MCIIRAGNSVYYHWNKAIKYPLYLGCGIPFTENLTGICRIINFSIPISITLVIPGRGGICGQNTRGLCPLTCWVGTRAWTAERTGCTALVIGLTISTAGKILCRSYYLTGTRRRCLSCSTALYFDASRCTPLCSYLCTTCGESWWTGDGGLNFYISNNRK